MTPDINKLIDAHHAGFKSGFHFAETVLTPPPHSVRIMEVTDYAEGRPVTDVFKIMPTSCRCGGDEAWTRVTPGGADIMIGCICHHIPAELLNRAVRLL